METTICMVKVEDKVLVLVELIVCAHITIAQIILFKPDGSSMDILWTIKSKEIIHHRSLILMLLHLLIHLHISIPFRLYHLLSHYLVLLMSNIITFFVYLSNQKLNPHV